MDWQNSRIAISLGLSQELLQFETPRARLEYLEPVPGAAFVVSTLWDSAPSVLGGAASPPRAEDKLEFQFSLSQGHKGSQNDGEVRKRCQ